MLGLKGQAPNYDRFARGILAHSVKAAMDKLSASDDTLMVTMQERTMGRQPGSLEMALQDAPAGGPGASSLGIAPPDETPEAGGIVSIDILFNNMYDFAKVNAE